MIQNKKLSYFGYVRSDQVILLLTITHSVSPSWPRAPDCDSEPYFSLEENFGIVGGLGCHVQGSQSLSVFCVCLSRFIIIIIIMYKGYM